MNPPHDVVVRAVEWSPREKKSWQAFLALTGTAEGLNYMVTIPRGRKLVQKALYRRRWKSRDRLAERSEEIEDAKGKSKQGERTRRRSLGVVILFPAVPSSVGFHVCALPMVVS